MFEADLTSQDETKLGCSNLDMVRFALRRIWRQRVRVYITRVRGWGGESDADFHTASKDIHLLIGSMDEECQHHLASLLGSIFREQKCDGFLLHIAPEKMKSVYVTKIGGESKSFDRRFNFAPAS